MGLIVFVEVMWSSRFSLARVSLVQVLSGDTLGRAITFSDAFFWFHGPMLKSLQMFKS